MGMFSLSQVQILRHRAMPKIILAVQRAWLRTPQGVKALKTLPPSQRIMMLKVHVPTGHFSDLVKGIKWPSRKQMLRDIKHQALRSRR